MIKYEVTKMKCRTPLEVYSLASQTLTHSAAFSSFRINTWMEGLAHCLYPFASMITIFNVM